MKQPDCDQLLQHCAHGVIGTDAEGKVTYINRKAKEIIRFSDRLENGVDIVNLLPVTGLLILETIKSGQPHTGHQVEGKKEHLIVSISALKEGENINGAVCSFVDMNEFEAVANKLDSVALMDKKFKTVFEASFDGIWLCDGQGRVLKVNKATEKLMGLNRSEIIGEKITDIAARGIYNITLTDEVIRTRKKVSQLQTAILTGKRILCTGIPVLDKTVKFPWW